MKKIFILLIVIFKISIANAQWQQLPDYPANGNANTIIVINDTIIASSIGNAYDMTGGLFTSTDYGITWSPKNTSLGTSATPLIKDGGYLYAGTNGQGVYLSTDKGNSWTAQNNGLSSSLSENDLIINNTDLYLCGYGIFYSADSAKTWTNISFPGTVQAYSIIVTGDTIISSFATNTVVGVYRSIDNGINWTLIDTSTGLKDIYINKFTKCNNRIFAISAEIIGTGYVYISSNNGISWTLVNGLYDQGSNTAYNFICYNETIFLATSNGVYKSNDYGLNWIYAGCSNTESLAIIRDTLYTGTGFHGIWKRALSDFAGINENTLSTNEIKVYPNPAKDNLTIETNLNTEQRLEILNLLGQTIYTNIINKKVTVNTSAFPSGVYIIKLYTDKETVVRKFVKQ